MKSKLLCLLMFVSVISVAQNNTDLNLIQTIEELSTHSETIGGTEMKYTTKLEYNKNTGRYILTEIQDYGKKKDKTTITFYKDDIDTTNMRYIISKIDENLYSTFLEISTKNKSVEWEKLSAEKGREFMSVSDTEFKDKIRLGANLHLMSEYLANKYINSWKKLLEIKQSEIIKS